MNPYIFQERSVVRFTAITKMTKKEITVKILEELDMLPAYIKAFAEQGLVTRSEEPYGFAYWVDEREQTIIDQMAENGQLVYAVIKGIYLLDNSDELPMDTYLFVDNGMLCQAVKNAGKGLPVLSGIIEKQRAGSREILLTARTFGFYDETGPVIVTGRNGGLHRVY